MNGGEGKNNNGAATAATGGGSAEYGNYKQFRDRKKQWFIDLTNEADDYFDDDKTVPPANLAENKKHYIAAHTGLQCSSIDGTDILIDGIPYNDYWLM